MLGALFGTREVETRTIGPWDVPWGRGPVNDSGMDVNGDTAFNLSAVWACETLIADAVATLPTDAFRKTADGRQEIPVPRWVDKPNPIDTAIDFDTQRVFSLLGGNLYVLNVTEGMIPGAPILERWVLDPDAVVARREGNEIRYRYQGQLLPRGAVQHTPGYKRPGSLLGMSVVDHAAQSFGIGMAADKYAATHYSSGASPSGALQVPSMPADVSQEVVDRLREMFMSRHSGIDNSHKPVVLTGGTTWNPISFSPEASQLLETRRFQRSEIASWFRVPPFMIGDVERSTSWGTGIEQQGIGFVTYTLRPWLTRLELADSMLLPRPQFIRKNVDALIRGDIAARTSAHTAGRNGGWLSVNDIRRIEDLPPVDGGDEYLTPLNMAPVGGSDVQA